MQLAMQERNPEADGVRKIERPVCVPDRRSRSASAAAQALKITEWIRTGRGIDTDPDETVLFTSLQTCAYLATRQPVRGPGPETQQSPWFSRWKLIRDFLVQRNCRLAYAMVGRFRAQYADKDELLSDALYTLMRAVERFDPWRGYRFSTYACNAIARELARRDSRENRFKGLFRVPYESLFEMPGQSQSIDSGLNAEELHQTIKRNLGDLSDLESRVLGWRFPLTDGPRLGLQAVGDLVGLSKERVRQIQNIALGKLREAMGQDPAFA
jgi:RNA polymerase sigma factor (sigma-70 family)